MRRALAANEPVRALQQAHAFNDGTPLTLVLLGHAYLCFGSVLAARTCYAAAGAEEELRKLDELTHQWLDHPGRLSHLFPPPARNHRVAHATGVKRLDGQLKVLNEVGLGYSLYQPDSNSASIIGVAVCFHGNGENADAYQVIASTHFFPHGLALLCVEYRGYGRSTAHPPKLTSLLSDVEPLVENDELLSTVFAQAGLSRSLPMIIFGRSLGAHAAIHLCALSVAVGKAQWAAGLVLDSAVGSVRHWEAEVPDDDGGDADGRPPLPGAPAVHTIGLLENLGKMRALVALPTLLLHGSEDALVPPFQAELLRRCHPAARLVHIAGHGHNDLAHAPEYSVAIANFVYETITSR